MRQILILLWFTSVTEEVKKAEIKMYMFLAEHDLPFKVMDYLSELLEKYFHDSEIAVIFMQTDESCRIEL